jgi:membrane fusion protein, heavy metal efflux system
MSFSSFESVMSDHRETSDPYTLARRQQILLVVAMALAAGLAGGLLILSEGALSSGQATAQPAAPRMARFVPPKEQLAALAIEPVRIQIFENEVVTDGYIASNVGFAAPGARTETRIENGSPILAGQSSEVLQAESDLATAKAQYDLAEKNEKRQHALYQAEGAALKDWQQAQSDLATAASSVASARNRLRLLGKTDREIDEFEQAETRSGSGAIFAVGSGTRVWLIANVREEDAPKVALGDDIEVRVPAYPNRVFNAKLGYIASLIDPNTHRLVVGALVPNADGMLRANMSASVIIKGGPAKAAPAVPAQAVIYEGDTARVWVANDDGSLALRDVTLGRANGDELEVTKGLSGGERIVTSGALFIDQAAGGE